MISDFTHIFNNLYISEFDSRLSIIENESLARLKSINFNYNKFYNISIDLFNHFNAIFSTTKLIDGYGYGVHCDGAFLIKNNNKWILCLCELKSTLTIRNFIKSKLQLEVSYLKIIKLLKVLKSFNSENFDCIFFIASNKPDITKTQSVIESLRNRNVFTDSHFAYTELIKNNFASMTEDCCRLAKEPIKKEFTCTDYPIYFIEGDSAEVQLEDYFK